MAEDDPSTASQPRHGKPLAEARWWYVAVCLMFAVWGSTWDVPTAWRWVPLLTFAPASILLIAVPAWRRPRPPLVRLGWRAGVVALGIAFCGVAAALGTALALQALAVPLPFTLGGLLLGIGVALLTGRIRRWLVNYAVHVAQNP